MVTPGGMYGCIMSELCIYMPSVAMINSRYKDKVTTCTCMQKRPLTMILWNKINEKNSELSFLPCMLHVLCMYM